MKSCSVIFCYLSLSWMNIYQCLGEHVYSTPDIMLFDSNNMVYFHVIKPEQVSYVFKARLAQDFGFLFNRIYKQINLVPLDPPDACKEIKNKVLVDGSIGLAERGGCSFLSKAKNAEDAKAVGILIADNDFENDRTLVSMVTDGSNRKINIPAGFILAKDSKHIKEALKNEGMYGAVITIPVNVTTSPELFIKQPPWSFW